MAEDTTTTTKTVSNEKRIVNFKKYPFQMALYGYATHCRFDVVKITPDFSKKSVAFEVQAGNDSTRTIDVTFKEIASFLLGWDDMQISNDKLYAIPVLGEEIVERKPLPGTLDSTTEDKTDFDHIVVHDKKWNTGKSWLDCNRITSAMNNDMKSLCEINAAMMHGRSDAYVSKIEDSFTAPVYASASYDEDENGETMPAFDAEDGQPQEEDTVDVDDTTARYFE